MPCSQALTKKILVCFVLSTFSGLPASAQPGGLTTQGSLISRGYAQLSAGDDDAAIVTLSQAVRANPSSAEARRYLAFALLRAGLATAAAKQMEYVVQIAPGQEKDMLNLAGDYFYAGQYNDALSTYQKVLAADPQAEAAKIGIIRTHMAAGQPDKAYVFCMQSLNETANKEGRKPYLELLQEINASTQTVSTRADS